MKKFRFNLALGVRIIGLILSMPSALLYTLSDLIKNKEDRFEF